MEIWWLAAKKMKTQATYRDTIGEIPTLKNYCFPEIHI